MILVTGASGTVGTEVTRQLIAAGQAVRAAYRTRRPQIAGAEAVRIDLSSGEGLDAALAGAEALFLLSGESDDQAGEEIRAVEAARRAGVRRLVKLSVIGAESQAFEFARVHRKVERAIEQSGVPHTLFRPGSFMQNFVTYYGETIRAQGAFYLPCGEAREAFVDVRDIARVAVVALTRPGHEGRSYDLLGPEALTYAQAAEKLSVAAGHTIRYVSVSDEEFRGAMIGLGVPESHADRLVDLYRFIRTNRAATSSSAIKDVTGQDPITFDQFARDYAAAWRA